MPGQQQMACFGKRITNRYELEGRQSTGYISVYFVYKVATDIARIGSLSLARVIQYTYLGICYNEPLVSTLAYKRSSFPGFTTFILAEFVVVP